MSDGEKRREARRQKILTASADRLSKITNTYAAGTTTEVDPNTNIAKVQTQAASDALSEPPPAKVEAPVKPADEPKTNPPAAHFSAHPDGIRQRPTASSSSPVTEQPPQPTATAVAPPRFVPNDLPRSSAFANTADLDPSPPAPQRTPRRPISPLRILHVAFVLAFCAFGLFTLATESEEIGEAYREHGDDLDDDVSGSRMFASRIALLLSWGVREGGTIVAVGDYNLVRRWRGFRELLPGAGNGGTAAASSKHSDSFHLPFNHCRISGPASSLWRCSSSQYAYFSANFLGPRYAVALKFLQDEDAFWRPFIDDTLLVVFVVGAAAGVASLVAEPVLAAPRKLYVLRRFSGILPNALLTPSPCPASLPLCRSFGVASSVSTVKLIYFDDTATAAVEVAPPLSDSSRLMKNAKSLQVPVAVSNAPGETAKYDQGSVLEFYKELGASLVDERGTLRQRPGHFVSEGLADKPASTVIQSGKL
ncbi:hypothetical protein BDK51DRAFT_39617 [Blyttiomyces helicus]|uniref:Uncharacterized protein n=1 Tax=Blyttiomyces helicus TaxID=388810 RepID=A0A4P9W7W2_9FUNG|nr:hypothetical protein BDK51DRAFT_39617 [Blyttiomyces helicus]|eukprot:RKO88579.1 hypothetical protein BDK51DRAFT_39617 [Blyttiomyces helicus]